MDNLTRAHRRKNMQAIRSKETSIEMKLRKALWEKGYRYRKNYSKLIGKPDIVFVSLKIVIFCDSEFFHGFDWENRKSWIKSNRGYWIPKIESNMKKDKLVNKTLRDEGWKLLRFWGKEIEKNLEKCVSEIEMTIKSRMEQVNGNIE